MKKPYIFSSAASKIVPAEHLAVKMFNKLIAGDVLSRGEKNNLFHKLQSNSGNYDYKFMGWVFPFKPFLSRYLVKYKDTGWIEIWAFDKTCIRSSWYTSRGIIEIIQC